LPMCILPISLLSSMNWSFICCGLLLLFSLLLRLKTFYFPAVVLMGFSKRTEAPYTCSTHHGESDNSAASC
jgi:hypothetical protein